ncbi:MAG: hypothetical protein WCX69_06010 [Candidatus Paceibacterota bacterium]
MVSIQDPKEIQRVLTRVYETLKFVSEETKNALNDLAAVQQLAVSAELLKSLTETEVATLNSELAAKSDEEKKALIEGIAKAHAADDDFKARAQVAAKKVLDDHIAYLKTRGDDAQKAEIAKILAEIG